MKRQSSIKRSLVLILPVVLIFFISFSLLWGDEPEKKGKDVDFIWHKYDQGLKKAEKEKKHLLVYFFTNYCGYCRKMEKNTFSDQKVKEVLNSDYVSVRVDGGSRNKIKFNGAQITERELASKYRVRGYPASWFLKPDGEKIAPLMGYTPPERFLVVLEYVKDGAYEKMTFSEYLEKKKEVGKSKK
ncbi:MAG: hypothetical protein AMJ90_03830 [candidate division Zixibacteria bacterium SM23_73_2]|nr:MAG: hypothetical protein AMJ90_03830 [candidate division Zixibacteria bacterium SM23_73_2]